jgi:excisionase family DNA binding protein
MDAFTLKTLAARWGCHRRTIMGLIKEGKLRSFRVGTLVRVSTAEVERYEGQPLTESQGLSRSIGELHRSGPTPRRPSGGRG